MKLPLELEIGKTYNIAFTRGRYEINYANHVTCIKITKIGKYCNSIDNKYKKC